MTARKSRLTSFLLDLIKHILKSGFRFSLWPSVMPDGGKQCANSTHALVLLK